MDRRQVYIGLLVAVGLGGCAAPAPRTDAQMGQSLELARAQQTFNPGASLDARPVEMIDGKSANALIDRYHKGFAMPTEIDIFEIGVGEGDEDRSTLGPVLKGSSSRTR